MESSGATTMKHRIAAPIPEAITQLQRQLEQFRSSRPGRKKLPESLVVAGSGRVGPTARLLCRRASATVGLHPVEAAARRNAEAAKKAEPTSVCRTDRERRGSLAGVCHRV